MTNQPDNPLLPEHIETFGFYVDEWDADDLDEDSAEQFDEDDFPLRQWGLWARFECGAEVPVISYRPYTRLMYHSTDPEFYSGDDGLQTATQTFYEHLGFQGARLAEGHTEAVYDSHVFAPDDMPWYEVQATRKVINAFVEYAPDVSRELDELLARSAQAATERVEEDNHDG